MSYITVQVKSEPNFNEILMADLGEIGFDSFMENEDDNGFQGSIDKELFQLESVQAIFSQYEQVNIEFEWQEEEKQNWNKLWESNYPYIIINDDCAIRATFHQLPRPYKYELVITPKMSFGTGHHSTTHLMVEFVLATNFDNHQVLDAGCGTGILGILAQKRGAVTVDACDIEDWAVENSIENSALNEVELNIKQGTASLFESNQNYYDTVLANINKNVILEELPLYASLLKVGGSLITSGFYEKDISDIEQKANTSNLNLVSSNSRNDWASLLFTKTS